MNPNEWAEVFRAGRTATLLKPTEWQLPEALKAMEAKAKEIASRGRVPEDSFRGVPVSKLTYEQALDCRDFLYRRGKYSGAFEATRTNLIPASTLDTVNEIIAKGPEICGHPYAVNRVGESPHCGKCGQELGKSSEQHE